MQDFKSSGTGSVNVSAPQAQAPDDALQQQMHASVSEAAERVTFHRVELERWERLGRAAARALRELEYTLPVEKQAPDGFLPNEPQQTAVPEGFR